MSLNQVQEVQRGNKHSDASPLGLALGDGGWTKGAAQDAWAPTKGEGALASLLVKPAPDILGKAEVDMGGGRLHGGMVEAGGHGLLFMATEKSKISDASWDQAFENKFGNRAESTPDTTVAVKDTPPQLANGIALENKETKAA